MVTDLYLLPTTALPLSSNHSYKEKFPHLYHKIPDIANWSVSHSTLFDPMQVVLDPGMSWPLPRRDSLYLPSLPPGRLGHKEA
jgi:hypothetical protein